MAGWQPGVVHASEPKRCIGTKSTPASSLFERTKPARQVTGTMSSMLRGQRELPWALILERCQHVDDDRPAKSSLGGRSKMDGVEE